MPPVFKVIITCASIWCASSFVSIFNQGLWFFAENSLWSLLCISIVCAINHKSTQVIIIVELLAIILNIFAALHVDWRVNVDYAIWFYNEYELILNTLNLCELAVLTFWVIFDGVNQPDKRLGTVRSYGDFPSGRHY